MENADMFNAATKQQTFHMFLERMKHPSAADLVRSIKSFIDTFNKSPVDPESNSRSLQDFLSTTEVAFRAHPLWAGATEEELENAAEGLEKYVMTKIFSRAYAPLASDAEKDQELFDKIILLNQFVKPEHLELPVSFHEEASWLLAQKELLNINMYKSPRDKLVCILNCCRVINNLLLMAKSGTPPGAEEFLPALIFVVIKANPPQLHSNLQFIERYRHTSRLVAEASYFYTSLVSVESFIEKLDAKSLSMDEAEFEEKMEAARAAVQASERPTTPEKGPRTSAKTNVSPAKESSSATRKTSPADNKVSVAKLEAGGASGVVEADLSGQLMKEYPFIYASAGDLRVEDVETLLNQYKEVVLRYVALCKGLESEGRKHKPKETTARTVVGDEHLQEATTVAEESDISWDKPHEEEQWEKVTQASSDDIPVADSSS